MDRDEPAERQAYVAAAREWLGTPFHDNAALRGVGVDCAQLVRSAAVESGLRRVEPTGAYSHQWMLHRDDDRLVAFVLRYTGEIGPDAARAGDLVIYRVGRAYAHLAIITGPGRIIHAHKGSGAVIESGMDDYDLDGRDRRFFSPWA